MTRRITGLVVGFVVTVGISAWAQSETSVLEGAWVIEDYSGGLSDNRVSNPTGLAIFSGRHYAITFVRNTDRPALSRDELARASGDQLRDVWGGITATAGTFKISGNTMTTRASVAKNASSMAEGAYYEWVMTLDGDSLVLTLVRGAGGGTPANSPTLRLRRVD